jgi:hypothetical protein
LPTRYFHTVFTVDHALNPVILTNKGKRQIKHTVIVGGD